MNRLLLSFALIALCTYGAIAGHAQSSRMAVCPDPNPVNRPSYIDLSHQSKWDIDKVVSWMHKPDSDVLVPGAGLVLVISHRGNWEYCPENTLESFNSAWDLGAEGIEMDIRLSAPGQDAGVNYPEGEIFLSHDYDIRGEAPNPERRGDNYIYTLTPAEIRNRNMADRHGLILKDSSGNYLHMRSLTDLLANMHQRADALNLVQDAGSGWKIVRGGALLILDVKGTVRDGKGADQYQTFIEALKELNDFQSK